MPTTELGSIACTVPTYLPTCNNVLQYKWFFFLCLQQARCNVECLGKKETWPTFPVATITVGEVVWHGCWRRLALTLSSLSLRGFSHSIITRYLIGISIVAGRLGFPLFGLLMDLLYCALGKGREGKAWMLDVGCWMG